MECCLATYYHRLSKYCTSHHLPVQHAALISKWVLYYGSIAVKACVADNSSALDNSMAYKRADVAVVCVFSNIHALPLFMNLMVWNSYILQGSGVVLCANAWLNGSWSGHNCCGTHMARGPWPMHVRALALVVLVR